MSKKMICNTTTYNIVTVGRSMPLRIRTKPPKRIVNKSSTAENLPEKIRKLIELCIKDKLITVNEILSPTRMHYISECRFMAMYILVVNYGLSTVQVGSLFNRDHSSVIHARETVRGWIEFDKPFRIRFEKILSEINLPDNQ